MSKVLITGGAGFIGSHITEKLLEKKYKIIIIDNLSSGNIDNIPKNNNIDFYNKDIVNDVLEDIFETQKPDYVIHLAAQTSVAYSTKNPYEDANLNIMASIKIIELAKKYNVKKIIAASSAAVYGVPQYLPIDEKHPTEPISQYGLSKLAMEKYIKLSGIPYIIFRFSNAFGPRQKSSKESGVIAIFNDAMLDNKPINIYGDGTQIRDFIYVEDIAKICAEALESSAQFETINFSTNKGVSLQELFTLMKEIFHYEKDAQYLPKRPGEIKNSILTNKKALAIFNNTKTIDLSSGLMKLRKFYE